MNGAWWLGPVLGVVSLFPTADGIGGGKSEHIRERNVLSEITNNSDTSLFLSSQTIELLLLISARDIPLWSSVN